MISCSRWITNTIYVIICYYAHSSVLCFNWNRPEDLTRLNSSPEREGSLCFNLLSWTHIPLINLHLVVWQQRNIILLFLTSVASPICSATDIWQLNTTNLPHNLVLYRKTLWTPPQRSLFRLFFFYSACILSWWALQGMIWRFNGKIYHISLCWAARWEWTGINIAWVFESSCFGRGFYIFVCGQGEDCYFLDEKYIYFACLCWCMH